MSVGLVVVRTETRDDNIGPKAPDHPDDVRQDLVAIPNPQRLRGIFRETEVDRAGEELPTMIEAARGQELMRPDEAELFAQFRTDQILAAIAAGDAKIRGFIKRAVRPQRHQVRVFVVGMRGDIEDAPKHIQFLERELDLRRVHRRREAGAGASAARPEWRAALVTRSITAVFQINNRLTKKTSKVIAKAAAHRGRHACERFADYLLMSCFASSRSISTLMFFFC